MRVLLVEDDVMLDRAVCQALQDAAHAAEWIKDGELANRALADHGFDVILLDLGLPSCDGLQVLRRLRARGDITPVLIISAHDSTDQRILGLDVGADDYLGKPFAVGELMARIRGFERRRRAITEQTLSNGVLSLELTSKRVTLNGCQHVLSAREFPLLQALLARPGAVLSRPQLETAIYGHGEEVESNAVDVIIHGLRKKVGLDRIQNVRGLGWRVERRGESD